jgi:hypothetical protein
MYKAILKYNINETDNTFTEIEVQFETYDSAKGWVDLMVNHTSYNSGRVEEIS